jgi:glycosyltransferase involved in cell wall biosynthesis
MAPLVTAIREPQRGGSQAFVSDLARGLAGRGHDVQVYAATGSQIPGIEVVDTGVDPEALAGTLYRASGSSSGASGSSSGASGSSSGASGSSSGEAFAGSATGVPAGVPAGSAAEEAFAGVYRSVRGIRYDVIHNHAFDAPAIRLATALRAPVVHTLHLPPDEPVAAAVRQAARGVRPPAVAVVSAAQARAWRRVVHVDAILPPYIPTRAIPWSPAVGEGAIFAGRLSPEKGAVEAIDIARAAGVPIDVYGDAYDTEYSREQIDPRRAWAGVTVHEAVPRTSLWEAMARAAVALYPARWEEPFGMAAAEAQACGTPVVAFRRGGLGEVIADGVTGFLVPPDDVQAAADAVGRTAGISRPACRDHAESHLDLDLSLDAHEQLYRRLADPVAFGG